MVRLLLLVIFTLPSSVLSAEEMTPSAEEIPEQLDTLQAIIAAQQQREHIYDNMHGVWEIHQQNTDGTVSDKIIEYWAREGKYFRVEWRPLSKDGVEQQGIRVIVRPEGHVRFLIDSSGDSGKVMEIDEADKGMWRVTGEHFYAQGNRTFTNPLWHTIRDKIEGAKPTIKFILEESGDSVTVLRVLQTGTTGHAETTERLASATFCILSADDTIFYNDGKTSTDTLEYTYESDSPQIPSALKIASVSADGKESKENHMLKKLQLEPAPMEVFDVDLSIFNPPSVGWSWPRRIMVLLSGFALISAYFLWRRKASW